MLVISFKNTALLKRGVWLTVAALMVFVAAPSVLDGSARQNPLPSVFALGILGAFLAYVFRKSQIHCLADEVVDCDTHLKVRRGRTQLIVPMAKVAAAEVATFSGIHRITVRLREPTKLGNKIEFLPQASLWSNLSAVQRVAMSLTQRANPVQGVVKPD